jgi:TRAP-type C4-dicarboxylate transport system substrate-binding protein
MKSWRATWLLALAVLLPLFAHAQPRPVAIKLASFAPEGSIWDKSLREMGDDWRRATEGRVALTVFAGGQQGEESTVVAKMRLGTLQAAGLTVVGLAAIESDFNVFGIPFFYESYQELHRVMEVLGPALERKLEAKGFVLLGWGDAGWLQVFSKKPIATLDEMKKTKLYTAAGDDQMVQWYRENGFEPRPLAVADVPTALASGLIEAVPISPIAALFLQWYRPAPYMIEAGVAPLVGATGMTKKAWSALSEPDRAALRASGRRMQERLRVAVPQQDREAVEQMKQRGLQVSAPADAAAWRAAGDAFARLMRGTYVSPPLFDQALAARDAFRSERAAAP